MKYLLSLLLFIPLISNAFVEFNYNRITSLCTGVIFMEVTEDGPIPDIELFFIYYADPWKPVNGGANFIQWNFITFPVPGAVQVPYGRDCYFHSCTTDGSTANLKMSCLTNTKTNEPIFNIDLKSEEL
jgi:hypothetical protein